jgi:hypothetical protein
VSLPRTAALPRATSMARKDVDTDGVGSMERGEDGVLAGAAAGDEQRAGECSSLGEMHECGLRAADVLRRWRTGVGVIPVRVWGVSFGHVRILSRKLPSLTAGSDGLESVVQHG